MSDPFPEKIVRERLDGAIRLLRGAIAIVSMGATVFLYGGAIAVVSMGTTVFYGG